MTRQEMREFAQKQVTWYTNMIESDKRHIEWLNREITRCRKVDKEQKEFAQTYDNGKYAFLYEGRYVGDETRKYINERRRWQRSLKKYEAALAMWTKEVEAYTDHEEVKEEETMTTTTTNMNEVVAALAEMGINDETPTHLVVRGLTSKTYYYIDDEVAAIVEQIGTFQPNESTKWIITDCRKPTKAEAIEAMDDDAEDPSVTLDEFIAKAQAIDNMKEETTMESTKIELTTPRTFEREGGRSAVTITGLWRRYPTDNWSLVDSDRVNWYRKPQWDEDGKLAFYMPDSVKGQRILMTQQELDSMTNNTKEEETMETKIIDTIPTTTENEKEDTTMKTAEITKFEIDEATYTMNPKTNRYAKTVNGKTVRIGKAEYDEAKAIYDNAWAAHEQEKLDEEPSHVEVENDLEKPAVLNENGLVDCSKCNCDKCVHRDCMRRNPRNVGGLGECPRLDNGIVSEAQKMAEDTGMELAEAELAVNAKKAKKTARKARKSKDIAYEGNGVTLTAKQVDFLGHLKDTCFWENGANSTAWVDCLCDEISGQFADKPMTVGAMISTLCEKGLGYRGVDRLTDATTGRSRKATYFGLTELGQAIYTELGLE